MHRRRILRLGATALPLGLAGCLDQMGSLGGRQEVEEETRRVVEEHAVNDGTLISVINYRGSVDVTPTPRRNVVIDGTKRGPERESEILDELTLETETTDETFVARTPYPHNQPASMDLDVGIPDNAIGARFETVYGDVTATDIPGDLSLHCSVGDVRAEDIRGYVSLETTTGNIEATNITGLDSVLGADGNINIELPDIRGATPIETIEADITIRVAEDLEATVQLQIATGDQTVTGLQFEEATRNNGILEGDLNGGGPQIIIRSNTGDIELRPSKLLIRLLSTTRIY